MIYLAKTAIDRFAQSTSKTPRVCVEDVIDRANSKPTKQMMASLRPQNRRSFQALPGFETVSVL